MRVKDKDKGRKYNIMLLIILAISYNSLMPEKEKEQV